MLKACFLPPAANRLLQTEMKAYPTMSYICMVNDMMFHLQVDPNLCKAVLDATFNVMNKVILDNIYKYVNHNRADWLLHHVNHKTFMMDAHINVFYINQILEEAHIFIEDKTEVENYLARHLSRYLQEIYLANADRLNICILGLYEALTEKVGHLDCSYYKFELVNHHQPVLLYSERSTDASHPHHQLLHQASH